MVTSKRGNGLPGKTRTDFPMVTEDRNAGKGRRQGRMYRARDWPLWYPNRHGWLRSQVIEPGKESRARDWPMQYRFSQLPCDLRPGTQPGLFRCTKANFEAKTQAKTPSHNTWANLQGGQSPRRPIPVCPETWMVRLSLACVTACAARLKKLRDRRRHP